MYYDPKRISDLETFFDKVLSAVNPSLLLITGTIIIIIILCTHLLLQLVSVLFSCLLSGDITDAKAKDQIFAKQFETEWKIYNRILNGSPAIRSNKTTLIDIRGNHGVYNYGHVLCNITCHNYATA